MLCYIYIVITDVQPSAQTSYANSVWHCEQSFSSGYLKFT